MCQNNILEKRGIMKAVKYFKKYLFISLLSPLFKFLEVVFELLVPLVIADIVDIGICNNDILFIEKKGLLLLIFALLGFCCTTIAQYFASKVAVDYCNDLRTLDFIMKIVFGLTREEGENNDKE